MTLVLIDGSPASTRAVDMAMQPNLFISRFDSEQLVLVHGWRAESKDAMASLQTLIKSTTEQIEKNKFHQGQVNYKIELVKVPAGGHRQSTPPPVPGSHQPPTGTLEAGTVAGYASERAQHHNAGAVVLGVGNTLNGKNLVVGSVALEVLAKHGGLRELWYIKSTGSTVRPTAPARILVVVDALVAATKGTHRCVEHVSSMLHPGKRGKVSVIIIANNGGATLIPSAVLSQLTKECTHMLNEGNNSVAAPTSPEGSPATESAPPASAAEAASPDAAVASLDLPTVSTFSLEPTPQFPNPTVNDVPAQFTKYLAQFKTDFLVLPPPSHMTFTEATTMILLTNPKNHIVVPTSNQAV